MPHHLDHDDNTFRHRGLWWRFLRLSLPVLVLVIASSYFFFKSEQQSHLDAVRLETAHHIESQAKNIRQEILRAALHVQFLTKHSEIIEVLEEGNEHALHELSQDFYAFAKYMDVYSQVRLLDQRGHEVVRVEFNNRQTQIIATADLQDKSGHAYFSQSIHMPAHHVFISKFTLNMEHGHIKTPYQSVIRYAAPVIDSDGKSIGIVVLNFRGDVLIQRYLDATDVLGENMLLNANSFFIHAEDQNSTWGSVLAEREAYSLADRFPAIWNSIIDERDGQMLTADGLFTFATISPYDLLNQAEPEGSGAGDWIILSHVSPLDLHVDSDKSTRLFIAASVFLLLLWMLLAWQWSRSEERREQAHQKLAKMHQYQRILLRRQMNMQEQERRTLARSLHDDLGQSLTSIQAYAATMSKMLGQGSTDKIELNIQKVRDITKHIQQSVRHDLQSLRPASLDRLGLCAAVEGMLDEFALRERILAEFSCPQALPELNEQMNIHLFRIVQEALTNAAKHAHAKHIAVLFDLSDAYLNMRITDDGCGMENIEESGLGLLGMRERTELLDGDIHITSTIGQGVSIHVQVPVPETQ